MSKMSIVVPCYNEEAALPVYYGEMCRVMKEMSELEFEIIYVDDGSTDGTLTILKDMSISYMACGENIAMGQRSAKAVATSWKKSEGHYKNMISSAYGKIGIGVMNYNGTYYWCQLFTN